jgi:hypothetical protein
VIYPGVLCEYLRTAVEVGRREGWKPLGPDRWVLNIKGQPCRDDWTDDEVIGWLASL